MSQLLVLLASLRRVAHLTLQTLQTIGYRTALLMSLLINEAYSAARELRAALHVRSAYTAPTGRQRRNTHRRTASIHQPMTLGERAADGLAAFAGSWRFIIGQTLFIIAWIILNSVAAIQHWDPYPWILLNLCMSTQAMYTGPIVMLSQNRQAAKDRVRDDHEAQEVDLLSRQMRLLEQINRQQLDILQAVHARIPGAATTGAASDGGVTLPLIPAPPRQPPHSRKRRPPNTP